MFLPNQTLASKIDTLKDNGLYLKFWEKVADLLLSQGNRNEYLDWLQHSVADTEVLHKAADITITLPRKH